jgi:type II secretory pathway component PulJ
MLRKSTCSRAPLARICKQHPSKRLGMTLVELLVGLAISTLMTIAGWRAIDALQTARDQTYRDATQWQALDTLFATLEADLRRADLTSFSGDATALTMRLNPLNATDVARTVRYRWLASDSGLAQIQRQSDDGSVVLVEARNARFAYRKSPRADEPGATSIERIDEYPRAVEIAIELAGNTLPSASEEKRIVNRVLVLR